MGLKSLAKTNRSGVYDFWENSWDSKILYRDYLFQTHIFKKIFTELFSLFFFQYLFKLSYFGLGLPYSQGSSYKMTPLLYFSKTWILRYQKWVILVVYYYNLSYYLRKKSRTNSTTYQYNLFYKTPKNYNFKF